MKEAMLEGLARGFVAFGKWCGTRGYLILIGVLLAAFFRSEQVHSLQGQVARDAQAKRMVTNAYLKRFQFREGNEIEERAYNELRANGFPVLLSKPLPKSPGLPEAKGDASKDSTDGAGSTDSSE